MVAYLNNVLSSGNHSLVERIEIRVQHERGRLLCAMASEILSTLGNAS